MVPLAGNQERASYNQWCYFTLSELEQPLWTIAKHRFALPGTPGPGGARHRPLGIRGGDQGLAAGLCRSVHRRRALYRGRYPDRPYPGLGAGYELPLEHVDNLQTYAARLRDRPALAKARQREGAESGFEF
ncbi:MAG: hypothetical protein MZV65_01635 [Chromatiales bacterium]|nr:hypothetical protein [Chromatiales bacterium]